MAKRILLATEDKMDPVLVCPLVRLWILRMLVTLGGHKEFLGSRGLSNDMLADVVGLGDWIDVELGDFDLGAARSALRSLHRSAERRSASSLAPLRLRRNVGRLAELVGLTNVDSRLLELGALLHTHQALDDAAECLGRLSNTKTIRVLSVLLELPERDVQASLSGQGLLARSGLLAMDRGSTCDLRHKLDLLSDSFASQIVDDDVDLVGLLRGTVALCSPAQLRLDDFEHVAASLAIVRPYLKKSIAAGRKGVNIFLYGPPGTGKSQLTRVLAAELGSELFEVASEDSDGDPVNGTKRLRAYRAAQSFFANRKAMILFDEAEDVFNDGGAFFGRKSTAQMHKAWINRALEDNAVPTVWLSNSASCLDPAFVRRFDVVVEMPIPGRYQRERILEEASAGVLDAPMVSRLAELEALSPAVVAKAASVISVVRNELGAADSGKAFELLIRNTLEAQGHHAGSTCQSSGLPELYNPAFVHADADLAAIASGLIQSRSGRLCLYGPSGTGKTAYGRWIAKQLGVPLLVKMASDLMSKWVGENEKNVARAFRQAEQDGSLLLIDEVDSFLRDRRDAKGAWEASLVNELLTQMESFPGVFIGSTNLMSGLDPASLRRFDLKVKFDYLKPAQARQLLVLYCLQLKITAPEESLVNRVMCLPNLTPGDFAAVSRQSLFRQITSPAGVVEALEAECAIKEPHMTDRRPMGFLS